MADNLKDYGSFIPGYRPGRRTADYLEKVMLRITYVGAAFLASWRSSRRSSQQPASTSTSPSPVPRRHRPLIVVSVCLDLVQKIDSHLIMRNYTGLMSKESSPCLPTAARAVARHCRRFVRPRPDPDARCCDPAAAPADR